jgi:hypothetical protein
MGMDGQRHTPSGLLPGRRPGTHFTVGWVRLGAGLDGCGKSHPPAEFDPRTIQTIANRHTDYALRYAGPQN